MYGQQLVHYLDDFLLIGGSDDALFNYVCHYLCFEEKASKSIDSIPVDFIGIEIDSIKMEVWLPTDKHKRRLNAVNEMLQQGSTNFNTLRSVIGFLSFCARVIPLGRPFLHNLFNFIYVIKAMAETLSSICRLSFEATKDLR